MRLNSKCFWSPLKGAVKVHITERDFFFSLKCLQHILVLLNFKTFLACYSSVTVFWVTFLALLQMGSKNVYLWTEAEINPCSEWNLSYSFKGLHSLRHLAKLLVRQKLLFYKKHVSLRFSAEAPSWTLKYRRVLLKKEHNYLSALLNWGMNN